MNYKINSINSLNSRLTEVASIVLVSIKRQFAREREIEKKFSKKSLDFIAKQSVNAASNNYFGG